MSGFSVLHLATHAAFVTGNPEDSFIVFANNDRATFSDVQNWTLNNFDLLC
jgi:CHAT domain-containing protein